MSRFGQPFVTRFCTFCNYTSPIYQVSVYRTIDPLVLLYSLQKCKVNIDLERINQNQICGIETKMGNN